MDRYSLSHLSDSALLQALKSLVAQDRGITAALLAHLAEFDERRLYVPAGYPSLFAYCVGELHLSEEAAFKRIHAARAARRFPAIFGLLAEGRLHLSAVVLLAPHLTAENADELLAAASHRSKAEIERLLAERFPRPDVPASIAPLVERVEVRGTTEPQHAPGRVPFTPAQQSEPVVPEPVLHEPQAASMAASPVPPVPPTPAGAIAPLSPGHYELRCTLPEGTYERLCAIQALLGHEVPSHELPEVLDRAFASLQRDLERAKLAVTDHPRRAPRRASRNPRHVPAEVRRAVWKRDQGRCTFVSDSGHRCGSRVHLELDHVEPVAKGGRPSVANLRLRCRAHNQFAAEREFGAGFMDRKRGAGRSGPPARNGNAARGPAPGTMEWHLAREARDRALAESARAAGERSRTAALARIAEEHARSRAAAAETMASLRSLGINVTAPPSRGG